MIVERKKLLSPFHKIRPTRCQPPVWVMVNCVSTCHSSPSAGRSWPTKFTGPTDVVALAASSSKLWVGMISCPSSSRGAIAPVSGVPSLRVWRSHRAPSAVPSNSSDRSHSGRRIVKPTDLISSTFAA